MLTIAVLAASLISTGCLFHSHRVESNLSHVPLQAASQKQLVDKLSALSNAIRTMNAAVEISTAVGGAKKGTVTEYSVITGFILAEKPSMLRMIGQFPIVKNRAFDMVSNAEGFELWIPAKNRFIIGPSEVSTTSPNPLENLRPQIILDALLFRAVQADEIAVLEARLQEVAEENSREQRSREQRSRKRLIQPNYVLDLIAKDALSGQWYLARKVYFNRANLLPYRQLVFNKQGEVATDAHYNDYKDFQSIPFPTDILIQRPQEEYTIGLKIIKLALNEALTPDQFQLAQPPGAQVIRLDGSQGQGSASATTGSAEAER
jgi:outer membrane lipoprotein-sorting protein